MKLPRSEALEVQADNERFLEELRERKRALGPKQAEELAQKEKALEELRARHKIERQDLDEWIARVEERVKRGVQIRG